MNPITGILYRNRQAFWFIAKLILAYGLWRLFLLLIPHFPELYPWWEWINLYIGWIMANCTAYLLSLIDYHAEIVQFINVVPEGYKGIKITRECIAPGLNLMFLLYIAIYPVKTKLKLAYIILGLVSIFLINILRLTGLQLIQIHMPQHFQFAHHYLFKAILFIWVGMLCILWIKIVSNVYHSKLKSQ